MSPAGNENPVDNDNNYNANEISFTIKVTKLHVPVVTFSTRDNQKLSEPISFWRIWKDLTDQFIGMNINKKWEKNSRNEFRYFLQSNFVEVNRFFVLVCSQILFTKRYNKKL